MGRTVVASHRKYGYYDLGPVRRVRPERDTKPVDIGVRRRSAVEGP